MNFSTYIQKVKEQLNKKLPGEAAWKQMAPPARNLNFKNNEDTNIKKSAVLLLLFPENNITKLVLIKRASSTGIHSGQISLPGGGVEPADKTIIDTALRETHEEIGIDTTHIQILGLLSKLFIFVSNYSVQPIVGALNYIPKFEPNNMEVEKIIEIPLNILFNPTTKQSKIMQLNNNNIKIPYYDILGDHVWGATAMILSEYYEAIEKNIIKQN